MIKAMLLSPTGEPEVVEVKKDYRDVKRLLEVDSPVTIAYRQIGGKYFDLWIDDEGLFKKQEDGTILSTAYCENAIEVLAGKILICNHKDEEMASLTDEDIELISDNLKRIREETIYEYNTNIGICKMKFLVSGVFLCYEV